MCYVFMGHHTSRELFNQFFHVSEPYNNDGWTPEERFREVETMLFQKNSFSIPPSYWRSVWRA
jgi:hypothetical protein